MSENTNLTIEQAWTLWQVTQAATKDAQETEHEALRTLARAAGKTFMYEGQLYQVRERKLKDVGDRVPYICKLKKLPTEAIAEARAKVYALPTSVDNADKALTNTDQEDALPEDLKSAIVLD